MKKMLILLGLIACSLSTFSQSDFRPGYVITNENDTLYGAIDYRGSSLMSRECTFYADNGEARTYSPYDIAAYRFTDSKYYVSKTLFDKSIFLEMLVKGELNVYFLKDSDGEHYYVEKKDMPLTEIPYYEENINIDGRSYTKSNKHYGVLNLYTQDAPKLQSDISKITEPSPANMISLAQKYHNTVCDDYSCVVYEKIPPRIKVNLEVATGIIHIFDARMRNEVGNWGTQTGIYAHIWLPRENEKLFFRTGAVANLFYKNLENNVIDYLIKVPIQFEYQYPKGFFRPKAAYGINFYLPNGLSIGGMVGANFLLNKHFALSLNYEFEVFPNEYIFFFPSLQTLGHSLCAGLYVTF